MNGKKAKMLRQEALNSDTLPWVSYEGLKGRNKYGQPYLQVVLAECCKAVYRTLKKDYKGNK